MTAGQFVLLRDGSQVFIRQFTAADREPIVALFAALSPESRRLRFHSSLAAVSPQIVTTIMEGTGYIAQVGDRVIGLATFNRDDGPARSEMSIAVIDAFHGRGIGTVLFERLAEHARLEGIQRFVAYTLGSNTGMIKLLRDLGFAISVTHESGELEFTIDLSPVPAFVARVDSRSHQAARASLEPVFHPKAVALIGASRNKGTIGYQVFRNLLNGGFGGAIYPVNPNATSIQGVRAYPSIASVPEPCDLAVIAIPANHVLAAAHECLDAGVRALVVISAGFAEVGPAGKAMQDELVNLCRSRNARLIGPNCLGILVNDEGSTLNATFAPTLPPAGTVAIASQSGALGIAVLDQARQLGIGVSHFVSMGNKADLSSNDLLECWEEDETTNVIVLYLESFGNPRRFGRIARRVGKRKPIVVVKGGKSGAGQRAAASHTAALAGTNAGVDALFRQAGVIRCESIPELFEVTTFLANQPLPAGNRVAIVTNAGGLGILCADACEANGLQIPVLSDVIQRRLRTMLPAEAAVANPIDMIASAPAHAYKDVIQLLMQDEGIDAVITLYIEPLVTTTAEVAAAISDAAGPATKPILACFAGAAPSTLPGPRPVPCYTFPEAAARALGHAAAYAAWRLRPLGTEPVLKGIDRSAARDIVQAATECGTDVWLTPDEIHRLLQAYGIPHISSAKATTPDEVAAAFQAFGGPVVLKVISDEIQHKSDVGGVALNLHTADAAVDAFADMQTRLWDHGFAGVDVQPMVTGGIECLAGVVNDPKFGPLIGFGLGGVLAEVMNDLHFRLHPLTENDVDELIAESKAARLLAGYRGMPSGDSAALRDVLLRLSQLAEDEPMLAEIDLNPIVVQPKGAMVLDARMRVVE